MTIRHYGPEVVWEPQSWDETNGWELLHVEPWGDDTVRCHFRIIQGNRGRFRLAFCKVSLLPPEVREEFLAPWWRKLWQRWLNLLKRIRQ